MKGLNACKELVDILTQPTPTGEIFMSTPLMLITPVNGRG
jgi:hypothetical protein